MVALERKYVRETVGRKNNCKLNFFSMYFVRNNEEMHLSFKNSGKYRPQALKASIKVDKPTFLEDESPTFKAAILFSKT